MFVMFPFRAPTHSEEQNSSVEWMQQDSPKDFMFLVTRISTLTFSNVQFKLHWRKKSSSSRSNTIKGNPGMRHITLCMTTADEEEDGEVSVSRGSR